MQQDKKNNPKSCCQRFSEIFKRPQSAQQPAYQPVPSPEVQASTQERHSQLQQIESQFLNKILSKDRRKMYSDLLNKYEINTIEKLMLCFQNSRSSLIGRRCTQVEFIILESIYFQFNSAPRQLQWDYRNATLISNEELRNLQEQNKNLKIKNILLVGTTGQGKTTLINSFYNFINEVDLTNEFRFVVIDVDDLNKTGKSVTQNVNQYKIKIKDDLIFNIIDTPGLGDTSGYSRDQNIMDQISQQIKILHNDNQRIHQVIIVSQLSSNYIVQESHTFQQMAILNVLKLFGFDMAQNYTHALTFSDFTIIQRKNFTDPKSIFFVLSQQDQLIQTQQIQSQTLASPINSNTPIMQSSNNINQQYQEYLQFQNSVYFSKQTDIISNLQFRKNCDSYNQMINRITISEGFQLDTTISVIEERNRLKEQITNLGDELKLRVKIDQNIQSNIRKIEGYNEIAQLNEKFFYIEIIPQIQIKQCSQGIYMTNCNSCKKTCHRNCLVSNERLNSCNMMIRDNQNSYICQSCEHPVENHLNQNFEYIIVLLEEKKFYEDMLAEHDNALNMKQTMEKILQKQYENEKENDATIYSILDKLKTCFNNLFSSALYMLDLRERSLKNFLYRYYQNFENQLERFFKNTDDIFVTQQFVQNIQLNQQTTALRLATRNFQQVQ